MLTISFSAIANLLKIDYLWITPTISAIGYFLYTKANLEMEYSHSILIILASIFEYVAYNSGYLAILSIIFIIMYNKDKRSPFNNKIKYFFYSIYPVHLTIFAIILSLS